MHPWPIVVTIPPITAHNPYLDKVMSLGWGSVTFMMIVLAVTCIAMGMAYRRHLYPSIVACIAMMLFAASGAVACWHYHDRATDVDNQQSWERQQVLHEVNVALTEMSGMIDEPVERGDLPEVGEVTEIVVSNESGTVKSLCSLRRLSVDEVVVSCPTEGPR